MNLKALVAAIAMLAFTATDASEQQERWSLLVTTQPDDDTIITKGSVWKTQYECEQAARLEQEIAELKEQDASSMCIERSELEALLKKSKTE